MSTKKSQIDQRPFRSRSEHEQQDSLEAKYRSVAIPELVAALRQINPGAKDKAA